MGYGVDIRGAADTSMTGVYFVNSKGEIDGQLSEASLANQQGLDIEIMREDLSNILYDLTKDTIEYIWCDSITAIHETEAGVEV